jgi:putative ubiquitin-RnfH superfamily antitoxin RatB of RatAB toxin-antitoxin module
MSMASPEMIRVEVAYATPARQTVIELSVEPGSTIEAVIEKSGILDAYPEIDLSKQSVGVFSESRILADTLEDGDRVEIYRSLTIDPKDARRKRAKKV